MYSYGERRTAYPFWAHNYYSIYKINWQGQLFTVHCKKPTKQDIDVSFQNGKSHQARKSQKMWCITNSDIYCLIVKSEMESADEFES